MNDRSNDHATATGSPPTDAAHAATHALVAALDVDDPAFIDDPYPALGALREATPIVFDERRGVWLVTRFADIHAALRDRRLGRQFRHRFTDAEFGRPPLDARWADFHRHERWSLLALEPPDHTRIRRLVAKVFTPRAVAELHPAIVARSRSLLGPLAERDRFDLIADYAQPFSVGVICTMLGIPAEDGPQLLDWSHAIVKMYELNASDEQKAEANTAAADFIGYTRAAIATKRSAPDDSIMSNLVQVRDAGDALTDDEIVSTSMVLLEAGHEATVNGLANGLRALLSHPDQYRSVARREVAATTAIEELLRFDPPLQMFERWVLDEGVEIAGVALPVGATIAMLFGAAQRDPRRFPDPDRFDVTRGDTNHIGFGGGIHFCVGAPLARAELAVSLEELTARFPDPTLAARPEYHPTFVIRGLRALELAPG